LSIGKRKPATGSLDMEDFFDALTQGAAL